MQRITTLALLSLLATAAVAPAAYAEFTREDSYASSPEAVELAFKQANEAVNAEKYGDAIMVLEELLESKPNHADALNLMGYSYRKKGDYNKAFKYYKLALENNPMHRGANEYIGEAYLEQGDLENAQKHLATLKKACLLGCPELDKLQKAIDAFVQAKG